MITRQQIELEHSKIKSGSDFPKYVESLKNLGVVTHEVNLSNGMWTFTTNNNDKLQFVKHNKTYQISENAEVEKFILMLKDHQKGLNDYLTFCELSAKYGVFGWVTNFENKSVLYIDKNNNKIFEEKIQLF